MSRALTLSNINLMTADMPEKVLAGHVQAFFRDLAAVCPGLWAYHTYDSRRSQDGMPDWLVITPKGLWFLELKGVRKRGILGTISVIQQRVLGLLKVTPGLDPDRVLVVYPWDWPAIAERIAAECGVTLQ